jgi:hypothetical protein
MPQRDLLYAGITRAKKLVVLAGSRRALAAAVRTAGTGRRHDALAHPPQDHPVSPDRHGLALAIGTWMTSICDSEQPGNRPLRAQQAGEEFLDRLPFLGDRDP